MQATIDLSNKLNKNTSERFKRLNKIMVLVNFNLNLKYFKFYQI